MIQLQQLINKEPMQLYLAPSTLVLQVNQGLQKQGFKIRRNGDMNLLRDFHTRTAYYKSSSFVTSEKILGNFTGYGKALLEIGSTHGLPI